MNSWNSFSDIESSFRRPVNAGKLPWQLCWSYRVNKRQVHFGFRALQEFQFLRRADDQPERLFTGIVEYLPQLVRSNQHTTVFWHGQRFVTNAHPTCAFEHKIKFLRTNVLVQRIRALGWQTPQSRAEILAA